jgi:hypothetical protein
MIAVLSGLQGIVVGAILSTISLVMCGLSTGTAQNETQALLTSSENLDKKGATAVSAGMLRVYFRVRKDYHTCAMYLLIITCRNTRSVTTIPVMKKSSKQSKLARLRIRESSVRLTRSSRRRRLV